MKATVLSVYDEGAVEGTPLIGARGISALVDVDGRRTLFDAGMRGRYLMRNLAELGVEPESVDRVVLSHPHRANAGGLASFLEAREEPVDVYAAPGALDARTRLGAALVPQAARAKASEHIVDAPVRLSEHLSILGPLPAEEELCLVLDAADGPVVVAACCHAGMPEVAALAEARAGRPVQAMVGGAHIAGMKPAQVAQVAERLDAMGVRRFHLGHCSGVSGRTGLRVRFGLDAVGDFYAGTKLVFAVRAGPEVPG